jgi:hypothetical protein
MEKRYIVLDDKSIEIGGTNLTVSSIIQPRAAQTLVIPCQELTAEAILEFKDDIWILGNILGLRKFSPDFLDVLFSTIRFVKIEFDYNYCLYRGDVPHQVLGKDDCCCPHGRTGDFKLNLIYDHITNRALHVFFMSHKQREIFFKHIPNLLPERTSILSSCFSKESFDLFRMFKGTPKNNKAAILAGYGGWHSAAKGTDEAIAFCQQHNMPFDVLPTQPYENHLRLMSQYSVHVFTPIIDDTCPRCIIEARLMGVNVIANDRCQQITEDWWVNPALTETYLMGRPSYFWSLIDSLK